MTLDADAYRTLGLPRGATLDEVKRAYRRLAKINHPDAAGEAALPRFLAIQAAYEQLSGGPAGSGKDRRPSPAPRRAWEADRDRGDATRRAYGSRAPGGRPGGTGPADPGGQGSSSRARSEGAAGAGPDARSGGRTGWSTRPGAGQRHGAGATGTGPAGAGTTGATGGGRPAGARAGTGAASGRTRAPNDAPPPGTASGEERPRGAKSRPPKATFGSTSYDGVEGAPFEPDWRGASWYGTTSGTYWTLNPKEYADPRKHGPEYQARARRPIRGRSGGPAGAPNGESPTDPAAEPLGDPGAEAAGAHAADPTHTTSSWWDSTAGPAADPTATGPTPAARHRPYGWPGAARTAAPRDPAVADTPPPDLGRATQEIARALIDPQFGGLRGRIVRAVIGWLPIALGLGWIVGELTGCGRFAATCDPAVDPILLVAQLAVLGLLLLVPLLASVTTMASLAVLATSLVAALILSATGDAADADLRRMALGGVLAIAWVVGLWVAVTRLRRVLPPPTSPVS